MVRTILAAALVAVSLPAAAATFDFETVAVGPVAGETLVLNDDGLTATFTGTGLQVRDGLASLGYGDRSLSSLGDSQLITVVFSAPVNQVTILNPLNSVTGGEIDTIVFRAFDLLDNELGSITSDLDLITLAFAGIARVTFDDVGDTGYLIDSVTTDGIAVPAPGALALFGLGIVALAAARRR